jgi:hypothetical protein
MSTQVKEALDGAEARGYDGTLELARDGMVLLHER